VAVEEALDISDAPLQHWELNTHALLVCLAKRGLMTTDELRRGVEALEPAAYIGWPYYGKWASAMGAILLERGVITQQEVSDALSVGSEHVSAAFEVGDRVRVRKEDAGGVRWRKPHLRVPGYIFGLEGVVETYVGSFADPELLSFRVSGPKQGLYRVAFRMRDIAASCYHNREQHGDSEHVAVGTAHDEDSIVVDVYASWLERVVPSALHLSLAAPAPAAAAAAVSPQTSTTTTMATATTTLAALATANTATSTSVVMSSKPRPLLGRRLLLLLPWRQVQPLLHALEKVRLLLRLRQRLALSQARQARLSVQRFSPSLTVRVSSQPPPLQPPRNRCSLQVRDSSAQTSWRGRGRTRRSSVSSSQTPPLLRRLLASTWPTPMRRPSSLSSRARRRRTTSSSARSAPAIRLRSWASRRPGTRAGPTARVL
jgi:hypothetical protein